MNGHGGHDPFSSDWFLRRKSEETQYPQFEKSNGVLTVGIHELVEG